MFEIRYIFRAQEDEEEEEDLEGAPGKGGG